MEKKSWLVAGRAFNRKTGRRVGEVRKETVNNENTLFANCKSIIDVKDAYESFWNDLNPNSDHVVFVSEITIL